MGNLARDVLFRMPGARLYFLSANCAIRSKARAHLKHGLFCVNVTKFMYVIWLRLSMHLSMENSAGSNIFKTLHWRNVYL